MRSKAFRLGGGGGGEVKLRLADRAAEKRSAGETYHNGHHEGSLSKISYIVTILILSLYHTDLLPGCSGQGGSSV